MFFLLPLSYHRSGSLPFTFPQYPLMLNSCPFTFSPNPSSFLIVWILFSEQRIHFGLPLCKSAVLPLHLSINSFALYAGLKTSTFSSPSFLSLRAFYPLAKENQGQGRTSFSEATTRNNSLPSPISNDREHRNIQQYTDSTIQL